MNRQPTQTVSGRPSETERPDSADQLAGGDMQDDTQVVSVGEEAPAAWQLREIVPVADLEVDPGDALLVESPSEWRLEGWLARFCLLVLVPLAAGLRVLTGRGLPPSDPSPTTWLMLLAAAGLTAFGGWWLWVVTAPPYPLTWRGRSARRAALAEQREQVALVDEIAARAAAGESPATAWHEVARGSPTLPNGLPSGIGSAEDLADLSARLHEDLLAQERGPHGGPRVAAVLPFVACLLPAALLILLA